LSRCSGRGQRKSPLVNRTDLIVWPEITGSSAARTVSTSGNSGKLLISLLLQLHYIGINIGNGSLKNQDACLLHHNN
tara:strand:- start:216 stop:446 length:231 start_codon:yes stop_codon:yes gene_type:complete